MTRRHRPSASRLPRARPPHRSSCLHPPRSCRLRIEPSTARVCRCECGCSPHVPPARDGGSHSAALSAERHIWLSAGSTHPGRAGGSRPPPPAPAIAAFVSAAAIHLPLIPALAPRALGSSSASPWASEQTRARLRACDGTICSSAAPAPAPVRLGFPCSPPRLVLLGLELSNSRRLISRRGEAQHAQRNSLTLRKCGATTGPSPQSFSQHWAGDSTASNPFRKSPPPANTIRPSTIRPSTIQPSTIQPPLTATSIGCNLHTYRPPLTATFVPASLR